MSGRFPSLAGNPSRPDRRATGPTKPRDNVIPAAAHPWERVMEFTSTRRARNRLRVQGYACPADPEFDALIPWFRFAPATCSAIAAVGTIAASPAILGALVPFAALGGVLPVHPFELVYNHGIRRVTGTDPLPRTGSPRRFACGVATVWLTVTALAFFTGATLAGYVLGGLLVAVSGLVATTHICIPSMVYRFVLRRPVATEPDA